MRIITMNVNGIRSAANKGFFAWLGKQNADVVCLQETKAHKVQLIDQIFTPKGYHCYFFDAQKKGYSGVAIYAKKEPRAIKYGLGWPVADEEGRYLQIDYNKFSIASVYLPSGTSGEERQQLKYEFMAKYEKILQHQIKERRDYILCGDWNIAHQNIDIKNWRANQKNSGFLPEERAWLDKIFAKLGWIDVWRHKYPEKIVYTWWSNRANAWANNVGWRIDYQVVSKNLANKILRCAVYRDEKFSDHAPFTVDYDLLT